MKAYVFSVGWKKYQVIPDYRSQLQKHLDELGK